MSASRVRALRHMAGLLAFASELHTPIKLRHVSLSVFGMHAEREGWMDHEKVHAHARGDDGACGSQPLLLFRLSSPSRGLQSRARLAASQGRSSREISRHRVLQFTIGMTARELWNARVLCCPRFVSRLSINACINYATPWPACRS